MSLTIHCKYKYFDSIVQRAEDRRQKFHFCRLPLAVSVIKKAPNKFEPNIMKKAPHIITPAPNIMKKASNITKGTPKIYNNYSMSPRWICNGNRTEWSPIRSVIIRVITKSDDRAAGVRFVYHEYDYRPELDDTKSYYQLIIKITISEKRRIAKL